MFHLTGKDVFVLLIAVVFIVVLVMIGTKDGRFEPRAANQVPVVAVETLTLDTVTVTDTIVQTPSCGAIMATADSAHDYLPNRTHHDAFHRVIDRLERMLHQYCDAESHEIMPLHAEEES